MQNHIMQRSILCYGDSLTWGFIPGRYNKTSCLAKRYPKQQRWTGILQEIVKDKCDIIVDAINGRTTAFDEVTPGRPYKNGLVGLPISLEAHYPLDLIIFLLGTNDMKVQYHCSVDQCAASMTKLVKLVKACNKGIEQKPPKILIIAPPPIIQSSTLQDQYDFTSIEKSNNISHAFQQVARVEDCAFLDAASLVIPSTIDGVHLDESGNKLLGHAVANRVQQIFA
jgi:lysophospholipase L1-like esterase